MDNIGLRSILDFDYSIKSHQELVEKMAEPFITYKSQQTAQNQITIAGYKTFGTLLAPDKLKLNKDDYLITKDSIEKVISTLSQYLYTFAFQIGCDLPSEDQIKLIYSLLLVHSKPSNISADLLLEQLQYEKLKERNPKKNFFSPKIIDNQTISKSSLYLLIRLCLQIYVKSKKSNIGGIIERLIIGIRKEIEGEDKNQQK